MEVKILNFDPVSQDKRQGYIIFSHQLNPFRAHIVGIIAELGLESQPVSCIAVSVFLQDRRSIREGPTVSLKHSRQSFLFRKLSSHTKPNLEKDKRATCLESKAQLENEIVEDFSDRGSSLFGRRSKRGMLQSNAASGYYQQPNSRL